MAEENLQVSIGDELLTCRNGLDAAILEPVGGILTDDSTEGYTLEQLNQMVGTLGRYDRPQELAALEALVEKRRMSETR